MQTAMHRTPNASAHLHTDAERQERCWPNVGVDSVSITGSSAGLRAHAVVRLGGLLPADVQVELAPAGPAGVVRHIAGPGYRRMCSIQSYGNGAYVFESALLPHDEVVHPDWKIVVRPMHSRRATPIVHGIPPHAAGARRSRKDSTPVS